MSGTKKILTLCIVRETTRILLGMKKRGFGVGQWNGFGGKLEVGETIEEAARRELKEEAGLEVLSMSKKGILDFEFKDAPRFLEMHIFEVTEFVGKPIETEEMKPQWFNVTELPFTKMWPSDIHWYPYLLANKKFKGKFIFDRPSDNEYSAKILDQSLLEVDQL